MLSFDVVVVGAGLSGAVIAERYASKGRKVVVFEKRDHVGGNCFDYVEPQTGVRVSKYGAHLFHTDSERVWEYVNRFAEWVPWHHKVVASSRGQTFPVPVNMETVNVVFGTNVQTEEEMKAFMDSVQVKNPNPKNGEEAALARVGRVLFERIFQHYTKKQWDREPKELDASVLQRIPVRYDRTDGYFQDKHQALPKEGYTAFVEAMLSHPNITAMVDTDFFELRDSMTWNKLFFTGPVDRWFERSGLPKLEYRSLRFETEVVPTEYFQSNSVVNYPDPEVPFTRIIEYKHLLDQKSSSTVVVREYSTDEGEPYYPVVNERNLELYAKYQKMADRVAAEENVHFVGRLASFKYFNMDQAILNALETFDKIECQ
jgi:UDP-galactopyranose mutase